MQHLLKDWPTISQRFREAERVLLFFDYDGTLTPIASRPELAVLSREVRQLLQGLSDHHRYMVGVISGRSLADVRERVGLPEITYAGNHGLEIDGPGVQFSHPTASRLRPLLRRVSRDLSQRMAKYPGVVVEDKGLTLSVHYRAAPEEVVDQVQADFNEAVLPFRDSAAVKVTCGKMVLEVRPNVDWDKGRAISRLLEGQPPASLVCFFGDDVTDEDGFGVVQSAGGIAVLVGAAEQPTRAQYQVDSPEEVAEFLQLAGRV